MSMTEQEKMKVLKDMEAKKDEALAELERTERGERGRYQRARRHDWQAEARGGDDRPKVQRDESKRSASD